MPICTTCTQSTPFLYTVYESEHNLRLEQCSKCHAFVDPYVEHDSLIIFIDLILLKRGVYRHLLYNRGTEPRRLVARSTKSGEVLNLPEDKEKRRWRLTFELALCLVFLDAFIRWSYLNPNPASESSLWTDETFNKFCRVLLGTTAETFAFHLGIILACSTVLAAIDWLRSWKRQPHSVSAIRQEFRISLIPLTLFYSSLTKYFLLFLLTIWLPASSSPTPPESQPLPDWAQAIFPNNTFFKTALELLDDDKLDREWVVRNVVGGMSAGFGLRVILDDIHPVFTTTIILVGWAAKTAMASVVSGWVGRDEIIREAWLAYSIP